MIWQQRTVIADTSSWRAVGSRTLIKVLGTLASTRSIDLLTLCIKEFAIIVVFRHRSSRRHHHHFLPVDTSSTVQGIVLERAGRRHLELYFGLIFNILLLKVRSQLLKVGTFRSKNFKFQQFLLESVESCWKLLKLYQGFTVILLKVVESCWKLLKVCYFQPFLLEVGTYLLEVGTLLLIFRSVGV